jgi:isoleucyl-tRNA synthetase
MNTQDNLVQIEQEIRRFWQRYQVPEATAQAHHGGPEVRIVQQPLAVAGQPRAEQVGLLALSDLLARYRSMRGNRVRCQRGWSCHGLPVELAVEGSLPAEMLGVDLAGFTAACHDEALHRLRAGEALAAELGVWIEPEDSYATLTPEAIADTWAAVKRLWDRGHLRRERIVAPVCPRCATPLSAAEARRHRLEAQSRSIWMQLPWIPTG